MELFFGTFRSVCSFLLLSLFFFLSPLAHGAVEVVVVEAASASMEGFPGEIIRGRKGARAI